MATDLPRCEPSGRPAIGLSIVGSVGGLLTASLLLLFDRTSATRVVPWLVSYAVGTLLGAALLWLVPQALATLAADARARALLARHPDVLRAREARPAGATAMTTTRAKSTGSTVTLVIVGDAVHTFVDGVVIAAAALVSLPLGVTTALAVAAHEIPQEAGDFAILLAAGYSRLQALLLNLTSAIGGVLGAAAMLAFGSTRRRCCRTCWRSRPATFSTWRWPI